MIPFPAEPVNAEEALQHLRKSLDRLYYYGRTVNESATYDGYDLHRLLLATSLSPDDRLSRDGLQRSIEQNRDALDEILMVAFQLGYSNAMVCADREKDMLYQTIKMLQAAAEGATE